MYQNYNSYSQNNINDIPMYGLGTLSFNDLSSVIYENSLSMSSADLDHFRKYFFATLSRAPSLNELKMLDEIVKIRREKLSLYRATQIRPTDKNTADTLSDLYAKAKYLRRGENQSFSLEELSDIAPEYLRSIGCDNFERSVESVGGKDALLQPDIVLLLLLPATEMGNKEYSERVRALYSDPRLYGRLGPVKTVNEFGIISTLAEISSGVSGDLYPLANGSLDNDLSLLSAKYSGRVIACAFGYLAESLSMVAGELGLCARYIARTTNTGKIFFRRSRGPELWLDVRFVKEISEIKTFASAELPIASAVYPSYIGRPTIAFGDHISETLTLSADISQDPFNTALRLPLALILSGLAKGYSRRDIGISTEYVVPEKFRRYGFSAAISGILGSYRTLIEICVSARASVSYARNDVVLNCSASCKKGRGRGSVSQVFTRGENKIYFIPVSFMSDGLPDFSAFRAMCAEIENLNKKGKILSSSAVCGDFSAALTSMSGAIGARIFDGSITDNNIFGIILESADELEIEQVGVTVEQ